MPTITVKIGTKLPNKLQSLVDDRAMLAIHNNLARMCDPYVPMDSGTLAQTTEITPQHVKYLVPYAHYMYTGIIFGPNIPIRDKETGEITGWFSIPGMQKTSTGRPISYSTEVHPLATKQWDKAMLRDRKDEFIKQIRETLLQRWNENG